MIVQTLIHAKMEPHALMVLDHIHAHVLVGLQEVTVIKTLMTVSQYLVNIMEHVWMKWMATLVSAPLVIQEIIVKTKLMNVLAILVWMVEAARICKMVSAAPVHKAQVVSSFKVHVVVFWIFSLGEWLMHGLSLVYVEAWEKFYSFLHLSSVHHLRSHILKLMGKISSRLFASITIIFSSVFSNICTFDSHKWPRENFSLQYQYNIKQKKDEDEEKYKLGDYWLIQFQIL